MIMDTRRVFSVLVTFLVSLDMGDIMMIPQSLINTLTIMDESEFRTISVSSSRGNGRLLPFVGALVPDQLPGLSKDFYPGSSLAFDSFNGGVEENKILYRLTGELDFLLFG